MKKRLNNCLMIDAYWNFHWYALTSMAKVSNNQTLQCRLNANEFTSTLNAIITKCLVKVGLRHLKLQLE